MKGNFNQIINSSKPTLVDFYAEWCGHAKRRLQFLKKFRGWQAKSCGLLKSMSTKTALLPANTKYEVSPH